MRIRHLQQYVVLIMMANSLVLSTVFSVVAYQVNQNLAEEESRRQVMSLMAAVKNTASAALFSENKAVGLDAINGLLGTDVVYSAKLESKDGVSSSSIKLFSINVAGGSPLPEIIMDLESIFDKGDMLGVLKVAPNALWVEQRTLDTSFSTIAGVIFVIFFSSLVSAQALKVKISRPLVNVTKTLKNIQGDSPQRLSLPEHLQFNEIGVLVDGFNDLLEETNTAFKVERRLREEMQSTQKSLHIAKAQAENAAQTKSDFLATMSHEIRTPLTGVLGMLGFAIKDQSLTDRSKEYLNIAISNARALLVIVNDILDISKIEAGKLSIEMVDFDVRHDLKAAMAIFPELAANKSLYFDLIVEPDVPPFLKGDPARIRQVLVNFVGNAIKFTEDGCVMLGVSVLCAGTGKNSHLVCFSVKDTGIGISEKSLENLFQKFQQADISTTRKFGGSGLGLSISKQLIEAMGGEVSVKSTINEGSTFQFVLDMEAVENPVIFTPYAPLMRHTHKLKVLCAEDFETNKLIIRTMLENMGHHVKVVENGKLALDELLVNEYDLVLMDGRMPEMDGLEATQIIRNGIWNESTLVNANIRIVAITANVTEENRALYLAAGMNDFLSKPIDEVLLHKVIETTINEQLTKGALLNPLVKVPVQELDSLLSTPVIHHQDNTIEPTPMVITKKWPQDSELIKNIRIEFVKSLPVLMQAIDTAFSKQDLEGLGRLFHGIRGSAAYLDDQELIDLSSQLERLADSHHINKVESLYPSLLKKLLAY
jgi:signal transduction histidine kinase/DNA-binding response OmpR family regulator